jgi:hypothetical protein
MMRLPASKVVPAERYAIVCGMLKIISLLLAKKEKEVLGIGRLHDLSVMNRLHVQVVGIWQGFWRHKNGSDWRGIIKP